MENNLRQEMKVLKSIHKNKRKKWLRIGNKSTIHIVLIAYTLLSLFPFFYGLMSSFKPVNELNSGKFSVIPEHFTMENYNELLHSRSSHVGSWLQNSLVFTIANTIVNLIFNFMVGYALARIHFKGRNTLLWYFLLLMLVPQQLTDFPKFFILVKMKILSSESMGMFYIGIVFASMVNLYLALMVRQFFISQNASIEEAAVVDGLSPTATFFRVSLRLVIPLVATQAALMFLWSWNAYIQFSLWSLGDQDRANFVVGIANISSSKTDIYRLGKIFAASNISFVPTISVYLISLSFQKRSSVSGEK